MRTGSASVEPAAAAPAAAPQASAGAVAASGRRFPYPYRAMLAIASDLDETPDFASYHETARFLNTTEETSMGPGLGLEVGNSIYFDMDPGQFSYWNADAAGRAAVRELIRSGHVDCLHSFGDLATTRRHAERALDELSRYGLALHVWIDHAVAPTNFGADIMCGQGDVPGSEAYHADITCAAGVEYVWRGRITSVVGQDAARSLGGVFDGRHALRSSRTVAKEAAKGLLGRFGHAKYAMHGPNDLLRAATLRDGRAVVEFLRANPFWGGVENGATADGIASVLTPAFIERLVEREGVCVLYTHLGKFPRRRAEPLGPRARAAFRRLADAEKGGRVLVTTTRRLLDYKRAMGAVALTARAVPDGRTVVDVAAPDALAAAPQGSPFPRRLAGLTVYVDDPARAELRVNGRPMWAAVRHGRDHTGRPSIALPWPRLEFPGP